MRNSFFIRHIQLIIHHLRKDNAMTDKTSMVAVYGTLRVGQGNNRLLGDSPQLASLTLPDYDMYTLGGFPGVIPTARKGAEITVEIYQVTEEVLARLDILEGYHEADEQHSMYFRREIQVPEVGATYIYIYNNERRSFNDDNLIIHGDWINYRKSY